VEKITPILMSAVFDPNKGERGGIARILRHRRQELRRTEALSQIQTGGWFTDPNAHEVVMGFEAAELETREVGDMILMPEKNVQLKVVGILERTGTQDDGTIFVPSRRSRRCSTPEDITTIGIKLKKGWTASSSREALPAPRRPDREPGAGQGDDHEAHLHGEDHGPVDRAHRHHHRDGRVINTILTSVWERFQEIGILKTIGAMPWDIFS